MPNIISEMIQVHVFRQNDLNQYEHLLIRRADDEKVFPGMWQMVTGFIEMNERAVDAALRELKKETGLTPNHFWVVPYIASFFNYIQDAVHLIPVFAAQVDQHAIVTLSHEHSDFRWLSYADALDMLSFPGHKQGLRILHNYILSGKNRELFTKVI